MPLAPVPDAVARFLSEPHFAVVATLRADGSPHTAATWYDWEDGRVLLSMDDTRVRLRHLQRDPRLSLTVLDHRNWHLQVTVSGVVEELVPDEGLRDIDRLSVRYLGQPYEPRDSPRTTAWVRVLSWYGWDPSGAAGISGAS